MIKTNPYFSLTSQNQKQNIYKLHFPRLNKIIRTYIIWKNQKEVKMERKGQAAMEFLMTYGWAILAAIVVIGILGYYYFSSGVLTPSAGIVSAPFYLNAWNAKTDGLTLEIKNNGGETYTTTDVTVTNCVGEETGLGALAAGEAQTITVPCVLTLGETFKGDITITYRKAGSTVEQTSTGQITERVVAA